MDDFIAQMCAHAKHAIAREMVEALGPHVIEHKAVFALVISLPCEAHGTRIYTVCSGTEQQAKELLAHGVKQVEKPPINRPCVVILEHDDGDDGQSPDYRDA